MDILLALGVLTAVGVAAVLLLRLRRVTEDRDALTKRFAGIVDADAERRRILAELAAERRRTQQATADMVHRAEQERDEIVRATAGIRAELGDLHSRGEVLRREVALLDEEAHLHSFGFYRPRYDFATSDLYSGRLEVIRDRQRAMLKAKTAAVGDVEWLVNGSKTEGRKQINQTLRLMLRAFNGECDAAVARVRYNNIEVMEARIEKAFETINASAQVQQCRITREYLTLKLEELHLAYEYEEKKQAEKEEQRRIREQMRDEELARRELERARQDAEKEEERYQQALEKARREVADAAGAKQARLLTQIAELERRLAEAHERKERAISRAQLTRSGHVYVISNVGSFGEHVYKIGMTRRLDPLERIRELGDASVPFDFDIHAVIYADDAPALELELHRTFARHRVNRVNERKEFFRISAEAIADAVRARNAEVDFTLVAEAVEYRKTVSLLEAERVALPIGASLPVSAIRPPEAPEAVRL